MVLQCGGRKTGPDETNFFPSLSRDIPSGMLCAGGVVMMSENSIVCQCTFYLSAVVDECGALCCLGCLVVVGVGVCRVVPFSNGVSL